jgi:DnaJ-class molecular chaperone
MKNKRDFYEVLGISKDSSESEIKSAYRKQALAWHPDRNKSPEAEAKFKEINEAYEILSNKDKRSAYDQYGHNAFDPASGFGGGAGPFSGRNQTAGQGPFSYSYTTYGGDDSNMGFDFGGFSDPFEIFAQFFGGGFNQSRAQGKPRYGISISFMEAAKGCEKEVSIEGKKKTIKIPAGVDDGSTINFSDFYLSISVRSDADFKREGLDVYTEKEISFSQAALGCIIEVKTIDDKVNLKVRPGTQPNTMVRLKGQGIKDPHGRGRGDQYIRLKVIVPEKLSRRQREILEEFEEN